MEIEKENKGNTETSMVNTEKSSRVFKHFETMSFMPTQKAVYWVLRWWRGVNKQVTGINVKILSWEQILFS